MLVIDHERGSHRIPRELRGALLTWRDAARQRARHADPQLRTLGFEMVTVVFEQPPGR